MMTTKEAEALAERAEELGQAPEEKEKSGVVDLTQEEITTIDLILTKEQLAAAQEKLAANELRQAQMKLMDAGKSKAVLLAKLGARVGGRIKSAKIVGQSRIAYELE
jgi:hypothetical protein